MLDVDTPLQPDEAHRRVRDAVRSTGLAEGTPVLVQDRGSGDDLADPDRRSFRARIQVKGDDDEQAAANYERIAKTIEAVPGVGFSGTPPERLDSHTWFPVLVYYSATRG